MESGTKKNSLAWSKVYEETGFGNKYPTDGLVSLYHHFMKPELKQLERPAKVLDFGCSHGANARFFEDLGCEVYGIDISSDAIAYCIREQGFDKDKFASCDVLKEDLSIEEMFGTFDLVIASECLYYFSKTDFDKLLQKFYDCMNPGAVIYGNMHTWNHDLYRKYQAAGANEEGLTEIPASGTAALPMWVRIVEDKEEMRKIFGIFQEIVTKRSSLELETDTETLHYIGKKA